jgi:hypothetical protein
MRERRQARERFLDGGGIGERADRGVLRVEFARRSRLVGDRVPQVLDLDDGFGGRGDVAEQHGIVSRPVARSGIGHADRADNTALAMYRQREHRSQLRCGARFG